MNRTPMSVNLVRNSMKREKRFPLERRRLWPLCGKRDLGGLVARETGKPVWETLVSLIAETGRSSRDRHLSNPRVVPGELNEAH